MTFCPTTTITWTRPTSVMLDAVTPAASHALSVEPLAESQVEVTLTGSPTGTVTVAGTQGGSAITEELSWLGTAGTRSTYQRFDTITGITTSLSGATAITARTLGADGTPHAVESVLRGPGWLALLDESTDPSMVTIAPGGTPTRGMYAVFPWEASVTPRRGDLITDDQTGEVYRVEGVQALPNPMRPEYWQCRMRPRQP